MEIEIGNPWFGISDADSIAEFVEHTTQLRDFLDKLGAHWQELRSEYFEKLPRDMVLMLDSINPDPNFLVCCQGDCLRPCKEGWDFCQEHGEKTFDEGAPELTPVPIRTFCERCGTQHIDEGEWAIRKHRTHLCAKCGHLWRPFEHRTVGIK